ncbi:MAG: hypothetical protein J6Y19_05415, partial [Kiritimatiellae bacterium]|nr:hypothetical protein [Kiritimatiellia bacterium]
MDVQVSFLPDRERLMLVVRDIQASRRAFPLMEIAGRFVAQDDSHIVKLERPAPKEGEERKVFWQCRECKRVFCHKANAEAHVENAHLDLFFTKEERIEEPPAGAFTCVARCGLSGELLGPPNYHEYNERIQEIWSARFAHVPKAEYLAKIEIVHDEGLLEEWKEQMRHQTVYRLRPKEEPKKAEAPAKAEAAEATAEAVAAPEAAGELPAPPAEATTDQAEAPAAESAPEVPAPAEEAAAGEAAAVPEGPAMTRKEAQEWIRANQTERMLRESGRCMVPGLQARTWDDVTLRSAVDSARFRERNFPFTLSLALRPAFRHMRLHLFKINSRETYVTAVAPKAFDEATAAPLDREIVEFLRKNDGATRQKVLEGLRPGVTAESPEGSEVLLHLDGLATQGMVLVLNTGALVLPRVGAVAAKEEGKETPETAEATEAAETAETAEGVEKPEAPAEVTAEAEATTDSAEDAKEEAVVEATTLPEEEPKAEEEVAAAETPTLPAEEAAADLAEAPA